MTIILWRHASANVFTAGLDRPLDARGHQQAEESAAWLKTHYPDAVLWASPACRAQETGQYFGIAETVAALKPSCDAAEIYAALTQEDVPETVAVVGHLPWIGHLAALLSGQKYGYEAVNHSMVLVFTGNDRDGWQRVDHFQPQSVSG